MDWSKFDNNKEMLDEIKTEIENAASMDGGERREIPPGDYECTITKCVLKETKTGKPMVSIWFKVVAGAYEKQLIFYNQVVEKGFQIHLIKKLLGPLEINPAVTFENYGQFETEMARVQKAVNGIEFALTYSVNEKGFSSFEITQVFAF